MTAYRFDALRPGEQGRTCGRCGALFAPATRTQKYCPVCRAAKAPKAVDGKRERRKALVKGLRKMNENNTFALNDAMFRELERIEGCGTPEEIETEAVRADKVCDLASNIIANGKLMLQAAQMSMGVAESVNVPKALLGMGDGR